MSTRRLRSPQVNVTVSKEVIDQSVARDSGHCMIAEAIKESHPAAANVSVDLQTIRFSDPETRLRYVYLTPRVAQVALIEFDQGIVPEPLRFRLTKGQVTTMRKLRTPEQKEKLLASHRRRKERLEQQRKELGTATLEGSYDGGSTLEVVGGLAPPTGALPGGDARGIPRARRRSFGLRALDRIR